MKNSRFIPVCISGRPINVRPKRQGAVAAELALILPLLLTIVLACIDFGRFGYMYIAVTNSARSGAGHGCMYQVTPTTLPYWQAAIRATATNEVTGAMGFDPQRFSMPDPVLITENGGLKRVQVQVNYDFQMLVPWPLLPNRFTLSRRVEMRMIR